MRRTPRRGGGAARVAWVRGVAWVVWGLIAAGAASAHPLAPALLELQEAGGGEVAVRWKAPLASAPGAGLEPVLPEACRAADAPRVEREGTGLAARWTLRCDAPLVGATLGVRGLGASRTDALVRVVLADGRSLRAVLSAREPSYTVPERERAAGVVAAYLPMGVEHILTGWDHLAFVFGLVALVRGRRALLATITAFTLGHSVTLSLATLGFVRFPVVPVEVAIAGSLVVLGVEGVRGLARDARTGAPWLVAAAFGLLHGLGFAGALAEVGLPAQAIPLALFAFNLGIEAGQLAFVTALLALGALLSARLPRPPAWLPLLPPYTVGTLGTFLLLRTLGTFQLFPN